MARAASHQPPVGGARKRDAEVRLSCRDGSRGARRRGQSEVRSEEHTSELQSLMRISYAVFCLKKKHFFILHSFFFFSLFFLFSFFFSFFLFFFFFFFLF